MNPLHLQIITQERVVYEDEIEQATIPTYDGEITILPRHTALVSLLRAGELIIQKHKKKQSLSVSAGFIEMRPDNKLIILADTAEHAEEIDIERATEARKRAEEMLKEKQEVRDVEFASLQALLEKEIARERVGRKYRKLNIN